MSTQGDQPPNIGGNDGGAAVGSTNEIPMEDGYEQVVYHRRISVPKTHIADVENKFRSEHYEEVKNYDIFGNYIGMLPATRGTRAGRRGSRGRRPCGSYFTRQLPLR